MKPGRELDALIAEHVMGLKISDKSEYWGKDHSNGKPHLDECAICGEPDHPEKPDHYSERKELPKYSTDIAAAWEVVEKLKSPLTTLETCDVLGVLKWTCRLSKEGRIVSAMAETAPHAICLAAMKVISPD